jgi:hypothetical protein
VIASHPGTEDFTWIERACMRNDELMSHTEYQWNGVTYRETFELAVYGWERSIPRKWFRRRKEEWKQIFFITPNED